MLWRREAKSTKLTYGNHSGSTRRLPVIFLCFVFRHGDYIDKWPFIFKKLHQHGYATFFSEDQAKYASLHYRLKGFYKQPVDHWMRHFWLAASYHTNDKEYFCLGTEPAYRKRFRNIKSFYKAYPKQRKFSFSFFTIGHDDVNGLGYLQDDLVTFLKDMKSSGYLDNTFLVVMGDHGIRYGAIRKTMLGKLEERLPLLSISVPRWFKNKYPEHSHHLEINTNRLTSPYDLHATFQQILSKNHKKTYKNGQSLFTEISKSRTCDEAGNPEHFCPCVNWKPVDPHHKHIKQIGQETVNFINKVIMTHFGYSGCISSWPLCLGCTVPPPKLSTLSCLQPSSQFLPRSSVCPLSSLSIVCVHVSLGNPLFLFPSLGFHFGCMVMHKGTKDYALSIFF